MAPAASETSKPPLGTASEFLPEDETSLYLLEAVEDTRGALEGIEELWEEVVKKMPALEKSRVHYLTASLRRWMERKLVEIEKLAYLGEN